MSPPLVLCLCMPGAAIFLEPQIDTDEHKIEAGDEGLEASNGQLLVPSPILNLLSASSVFICVYLWLIF